MAKQFSRIEPAHREFILKQRIFFTGSAAAEGRVNISPKGLDTLRILSANSVAYLDLTGSGSETAAHLRLNPRLTIMFCSFEGAPLILRLYGNGQTLGRDTAAYAGMVEMHFGGKELPGSRQIVLLHVDLVQTSCGFGVPNLEYVAERPNLIEWAEKKGDQGMVDYRRLKNVKSIDGFPTGLKS